MVSHGESWLLAALLLGACGTRTEPAPSTTVKALVGGRIQTAPEAPAISDGMVLVEDNRIIAVGRRSEVPLPAGASVIDCAGATVTAGFWNSHVHFTGPAFEGADSAPTDRLASGLREMLTSRGVVHVVDTGSWLANTLALRR